MKRIGVLALQGSVEEHFTSLLMLKNISPIKVQLPEDLEKIDALILPGGESTAIGKLMRDFHLLEPIRTKILEGMPVWGTCAGMILLAKNITDEKNFHLGVMDITVRRNSYGGQLQSFHQEILIQEVSSTPIKASFIRAPWVEDLGKNAKVLSVYNDRIVAVQQGHMLATSFHPELSEDLSFHQYFVNLLK